MEHRFCSYTFLPEQEIISSSNNDGDAVGNGRRLLRCARCKDTYYKDQESQKAHWKVHKKVCQPLDMAERQRIFGFSARQVAVALCNSFQSPTTIQHAAGRSFLYLLQRLEILCQTRNVDVGGGVLGPELSTYMLEDPDVIEEGEEEPGVIFTMLINLMDMENAPIELLWAIPGMTNYILGHSLISAAMKEKQASGILPSTAENNISYYDPEFHTHPVFCNILGLFITVSAMKEVRGGEANFRRTPLAAAAARRAMTWWSNPYSRASIPRRCVCLNTPRKVWFLVVLFGMLDSPRSFWEQCSNAAAKHAELVPGLTVKDVFLLLTQEEEFAFDTSPAKFRQLSDLFAQTLVGSPTAWQAFSVADRALVAQAMANRYMFSNDQDRIPRGNKECAIKLQAMAMGWKLDTCLWLKVIKAVCEQQVPDDEAVLFFREWLERLLDQLKPMVLYFMKLAKEKDPDTPNIPDDAIRSICEFVMPTDFDDVTNEYSLG